LSNTNLKQKHHMKRKYSLKNQASSVYALLPLVAMAVTQIASAQSATMSEAGTWYLSTSYTNQSFDEFYAGDVKVANPAGEIERQSYRINLEYIVADSWALDLSLGYFRAESGVVGPFTQGSQDGLADTEFGIRHTLAKQADLGIDLAVRLALTVPGDYEIGQLSAPGDDAYGANVKFLAGYSMGGTRLEGLVGFGVNEGAVPEAWTVGTRVIQELGAGFALDLGYRYFDSSGSIDIGGPGFAPSRLNEVSEQGQVFEVGASYGDAAGRYYRLVYSELFDGENVGQEQTLGASVTFRF
jgi:hypothetical protein